MDYRAQVYNVHGGSGKLSRRFDTSTGRVDHAYFWLPSEEWGAGHGKRLMRRSTELYDRLGLKSVHISALEAGKYIWPMCGFQTEESDDKEHDKTLDAIQRFAEGVGFDAALPRFANLWDYEVLDHEADGERVFVTEADIYAAFINDGRDFQRSGLPAPTTPRLPLSKALLIYNATAIWPGVLRLERGTVQLARLDAYTRTQ